MRWVIAALVVVGLAVGVVLAWPSGTESPPDTLAGATTSTATSVPPAPTTSAADSTTTTTADNGETSHVVETVAEAEEILRNHYYQWFLGIYEQDEDRIRGAVILDSQVDAAIAQFGNMEFSGVPTPEAIDIRQLELIRSDDDCLAVFAEVSADFRPGSTDGVLVFRFVEQSWKHLSSWQLRDDRWEEDCESTL